MAAPAVLTKQVGPFPVWAWALIGTVGVGGGVLLRRAQDKAPGVTVAPGDAGATSYQPYGGIGGGSIGSAGGGAVNATPGNPIETNTAWRSAALNKAVALGYSATEADRILSDYLDGTIGSSGQGLLDAVLADPSIGLPPSPPTILPTPGVPAPEPPPPPATDPILANPFERIANSAYRDILGREGDPGGLAYWAGQLQSGAVDEATLRANLRNSAEGQNLYRSTPSPAPQPAPAPAPRTYTVKRGDTLSGIASSQGVGSWRTLYDTNKATIGSNPNLIKPGQVLTLP